MNSPASDTADTLSSASREAAADFRRRSGKVKENTYEELQAFLADVEDLVKRVANISDADIARARVKVANALNDMRRVAGDTADSLRDRARLALDATNEYVRDRPWTVVGLAAAVGLIVGASITLATRR
jgi:ElaB/YqjD/DUF883 family membrane-anchored ribosome-binding protein